MIRIGFAMIMTTLIGNLAYAGHPRGIGGLPECIGLAVQAALTVHAKSYPLPSDPIPKIELGPIAGGPSNGIDVGVKVGGKSYEVIAQATPAGRTMTGCSDAYVTSVH